MVKFDLIGLFFNIIGLLGGLLTIYGFVEVSSYRIFLIAAGIILIYFYSRWYIIEYLTKNINNIKRKFESKINNIGKTSNKIMNDLNFIKGWIDAMNHLNCKRNKKGAIDPLLLIVIVIIIILIILYMQGKL